MICRVLFVIATWCLLFAADAQDIDCKHRPPYADLHGCCPLPKFTTDAIEQACPGNRHHHHHHHRHGHNHHHGSESHHRHRRHGCSHGHGMSWECVLNQTGIIQNHQLNEIKLKEYLDVIFNEQQDMIPIVQGAFRVCSMRREQNREEMENFKKGLIFGWFNARRHRHLLSDNTVMHCVFDESFENCIPSLWNNTEACYARRQHMRVCKPDFAQSSVPTTSSSAITPEVPDARRVLTETAIGSATGTADIPTTIQTDRSDVVENQNPSITEATSVVGGVSGVDERPTITEQTIGGVNTNVQENGNEEHADDQLSEEDKDWEELFTGGVGIHANSHIGQDDQQNEPQKQSTSKETSGAEQPEFNLRFGA